MSSNKDTDREILINVCRVRKYISQYHVGLVNAIIASEYEGKREELVTEEGSEGRALLARVPLCVGALKVDEVQEVILKG